MVHKELHYQADNYKNKHKKYLINCQIIANSTLPMYVALLIIFSYDFL